jgi:hypothetical protein
MNKIPVGRVIGETFRFSFGRYFTLLGILWLPTLIFGALCYALMQPFVADLARAFQELTRHPASPGAQNMVDDAMASGLQSRLWLVQLLLMFFFVMVQVAMTKEILGLRKGPRFAYVAIGKADLLAALSYVLVYALLYAAMIAAVIVGVLIGIVVVLAAGSSLQNFDARTMSGPLSAVFVAFAFVVELAVIFAMVRLSFLIAPVAVAEKRIGLIRSWELTSGNFWRIVAVWLVTLLPLFFLELALVVPLAMSIHEAARHGGADPMARAEQVRTLLGSYIPYLPWLWLGGLALSPIFYGLWLAPAAFAYRALTEKPQQLESLPTA